MSGRKRIDIIVNPTAGSRGGGLFDEVLRRLNEGGAFVRCMDTQGPGHATTLAATAAADGRADVIVAAGGDGTINEVARGLIGSPTPLGILPLGTANVLGIEIGQQRRAKAIADTLLFGEAKLIGTGVVEGEIFLLMVGVGFDGKVVHAIEPALKRRLGKFAFIWEGVKAWIAGPAANIEMRIDGIDHHAAWVVVTNVRHYAGPFTLSPTTDISKSGIEVFLFHKTSRFAFAIYFLGLALGRVSSMPGVEVMVAQEISFNRLTERSVEVDGDAVSVTSLIVAKGEQFLRLVVPRT